MRSRPLGRWLCTGAWACALFLGFGLLAVVPLLPGVRAAREFRARRCAGCRRRQMWQRGAVATLAVVVLCGVTARVVAGATLPPRCGITWAGQIGGLPLSAQPEPNGWRLTRDVVTAPVSGLALAYAGRRGMELCDVGDRRLTVAFLPGANIPGGSTVGDVFLTGVRWDLSHRQAVALARHESRHADQWTVLTLAGGPLALPVLYGTDESLFPSSKNIFEQLAGLRAGGYPPPANMAPTPVWSLLAVVLALLLLLTWRRLRLVVRRVVGGPVAAARSAAGRCPLHTRGLLRPHC